MDHNKRIIRWASEHLRIPYFFTLDGKHHTYIPDVYCEVITNEGLKKTWLIEIKPLAQSVPPKPPKKKTGKSMKNFRNTQIVVQRNIAKWDATRLYCKKRGWEFKIITEKDLF